MMNEHTQQRVEGGPEASAGGFTLVELLVAMLILAIGIMAALSIQFTALGGAMASKDNTTAADVARRVINVMRVDSQQWRKKTIAATVVNATYANSSFKSSPLLASVSTDWTWVSLFSAPVDTRLTTYGNARYCAYARGHYFTSTKHTTKDIFQVHIAVVYPGPNKQIPDADCDTLLASIKDKLVPGREPTDNNSIQQDGYRVEYFGTEITRRGYLPEQGI